MKKITHKDKVFNGLWPMTKENTWYGYKGTTGNYYVWFKTKKTAIKYLPIRTNAILRATEIGDTMYINMHYLKLGGF